MRTYHVVSGKFDFKALSELIGKGKGKATLKTVSGGTLTVYDVYQSNGVIHSVDAVLLPKM